MVKSAAPINPAAGTPMVTLGPVSLSKAQNRDATWIQYTIFFTTAYCPCRGKSRIISSHLPAFLQVMPLLINGDHLAQCNPDFNDDSPLILLVELGLLMYLTVLSFHRDHGVQLRPYTLSRRD